jgi:nucleoid DNA-binding protein|tara:strand:+ start:1405 stop:1872 length:468 start_codon:yes stop_codon:yes gene_type:complete
MRRNPFDMCYIFMAKNITIDEILDHAFKGENIRLVKRVIKRYFELVYEYLLMGKVITLPMDFGELKIVKKKASELSDRKEKTKERYDKSVKNAIKEKKFNYRKLGYFYMIASSGYVYGKGMYLKPPKSVKQKIRENIINGKDYRYEKYGLNNERS